jgi:peptidoglycan/LPS O-acetylase OafA/YrhL
MTVMLPVAQSPATVPHDRAPHHFSFVDALRGLAILAVVMTHCGQQVKQISSGLYHFTDACSNGVELFFVVSAFTLFWSLQNRMGADRHPLKAFFVRRLFRIAPLFWIAVVFYATHRPPNAVEFAPSGIGWPTILATIFFVHGWYPTTINSVVPGGWSIGAEAMFYLCLPMLHKYFRSLSSVLWIVLVTTFTAGFTPFVRDHLVMHIFPSGWKDLVGLFLYWSFPAQFPVFGLGIALYFILTRVMSRGPLETTHKTKWSLLLLATAAFLLFRKTPEQVVYAAVFVLIAIGLAIHPTRLLVNPVTRFIGTVSYSIYIWHFWILYRFAPAILLRVPASHRGITQLAILYLVILGLSISAATLSYHLIERPSQRVGKMLITRLCWGTR